MRPGSVALGLLLLLCAASCRREQSPARPADGRINAVVSILPQAYFVERIAGERADISLLVGPGRSPATYEPTPRQMGLLQQAHVFFRIGVPFENTLMPRIEDSCPHLRIIDTRTGITLRRMAEPHEHEADHAEHDERAGDEEEAHLHHGGMDPHIWLDPLIVKVQARTICDALSELDPEHSAEFRNNLAAFQADLDALHDEISRTLAPFRGRKVFVYHPAFGYFTDRYGLVQTAVETGGKKPGARQLAALIRRARDENVKVIFVQKQFSTASARAVADATGGAVIPIDPLARDYIENLRSIARQLHDALEGETQ